MHKFIYETISDAETAYNLYIRNHIKNVKIAFDKFGDAIYREVMSQRNIKLNEELLFVTLPQLIKIHDESKFGCEEFNQYRKYHYPSKEDNNDNLKENYEKAWHHHYTNNPHHPEYWSCIMDGKLSYLRMPNSYFFEMLCDWISVSITNKSSVFDWWYNSNGGKKEKMLMLPEQDIDIIDNFIIKYKNNLDFSNS